MNCAQYKINTRRICHPEVNEANWTTFALLSPLAGMIYLQYIWNEQHNSRRAVSHGHWCNIGPVSHLKRRICVYLLWIDEFEPRETSYVTEYKRIIRVSPGTGGGKGVPGNVTHILQLTPVDQSCNSLRFASGAFAG